VAEEPSSSAAPQADSPPQGLWPNLALFLHDLFDLEFRTLLTTRMLPFIYGLGIVLAALITAYTVLSVFRHSVVEGFVWLLFLGPLMFIGLVTALRITLEFVLAVFRMLWHVEQVTGKTDLILKDMPRFGFWKDLFLGTGRSQDKK
jgi:hypothetical protein